MSEVTARKRGTKWEYRFEGISINGKRKQYSKSGFRTKKEAQTAGASAYAAFCKCGIVFEPKKMSLADLVDHYLETYVKTNLTRNAYKTYEHLARNHIKPVLGQYDYSTMKKDIFVKFFNDLAKSYTKKTLKVIKIILNGAYNIALDMDWIEYNPISRVKVPENTKKAKKKCPLTKEDYDRMIREVGEDSDYYVPLQIGWFTGMRIGEVLALTWDDVDLEKGIIHIRKQIIDHEVASLKTASSKRDIRIGKTLTDILKAERERQLKHRRDYRTYYTTYAEEDGFVVISAKDTVDYVCRRQNGDAIKEASLQWKCARMAEFLDKPFSFHVFRHTHPTLLLEAGATVKAVQARLGHSSPETTLEIYSHVTQAQEDEAVELFEKIAHEK